jgi:hypothetical protein
VSAKSSSGLRPLRTLVGGWRPAEGGVLEPLDAILVAWPGVVGPRVAQHSQPLEFQDGVLLVATRSSAWSQQLQFLEPEIMARLATSGAPAVTQLRFRSGRLRGLKPVVRAGAATGRTRPPAPSGPTEPAADVESAFERARRRILLARRESKQRCSNCAAPSHGTLCAPCRGERVRLRRVDLERLLYNVPWLDVASLVSLVPELEPGELDAVRRSLLQRWWLSLERVRRSARRVTDQERRIASSYVILQSGLAPEEITRAVMRNVLGPDLESRLHPGPGSPGSTANEADR